MQTRETPAHNPLHYMMSICRACWRSFALYSWLYLFFLLLQRSVYAQNVSATVVAAAGSSSVMLQPSPSPTPSPTTPPTTPPTTIFGLSLQFTTTGQANASAADRDTLQAALQTAVGQLLRQGELLASPALLLDQSSLCGPQCYRVDLVLSAAGGPRQLNRGSIVIDTDLLSLPSGVTVAVTSFTTSGADLGVAPVCSGFTGVNFDCTVVNCSGEDACVGSSLLAEGERVPCSCDALGALSLEGYNCTTFIANTCRAATATTTTTTPTAEPGLPSWVIPAAVCVGAALLILAVFLCFCVCCYCCFCRKSSKSVYFTQEGRTEQELSAYIYKNPTSVTYHHTGDVDDQGMAMEDKCATFQKTTTFTFQLGHQPQSQSQDQPHPPPPSFSPEPPPEVDH